MGVQKGRHASTDKKKQCLRYRRTSQAFIGGAAKFNHAGARRAIGVSAARVRAVASKVDLHVVLSDEAMSSVLKKSTLLL